MGKFILLVCGVLICNVIFSQPRSKEYLQEKSKKQKTTALILLGAGTAAILTGVITGAPHRGTDNSQGYTSGVIEVIGIGSCLASIPFFIKSGKNKNKAAKLSVSKQRIMQPLYKHDFTTFTAFSFKFSLK